MSLNVLGLGTAVPERSIDQRVAAKLAELFSTQTDEQRRLLPVLYRRTGVQRRYSVLLEGNAANPGHSKPLLTPKRATKPPDVPLAATKQTATAQTEVTEETGVSQSFYPPAENAEDCGPTTLERMRQYERFAGGLALSAARSALARAEIHAAQITHLVTVSCTGFAAPGVDLELIRGLGLPAHTARTHVGFMGCHGALNGLRVARAFVESDPNACVLLVAVELCSLHHQYGWQPDRIVANALFADGAAALVGIAGDGIPPLKGIAAPWKVVANGACTLPDSEDVMSWRIGNHGFEMTLSPRVPDVIRQALRPWLSDWLKAHQRRLEDVASWAIHPGGPRILTACADALGLTPAQLEPSQRILSQYGNVSSPTVLFILNDLMESQAERPCVAVAFGPGLAIEAALIE